MKNITSMWGPSLTLTKHNTTLAFGECDRSPTRHEGWIGLRRSPDGGSTWGPLQNLLPYGSPVALYSHTTDTVFVFFGEGSAPKPAGPPFGISGVPCGGGTTGWTYDASGAKHLANMAIAAPGSPLGVVVCEGAVNASSGDGLGVGVAQARMWPRTMSILVGWSQGTVLRSRGRTEQWE